MDIFPYVFLQGVKEVVDTWENMKFTVQRYFKGTQERGSILGSVDEILQNLDDNAVNLQSMAGSRFVGPFLSTIQQWEKSLSLISEVIEVRTYSTFYIKYNFMQNIIYNYEFLTDFSEFNI